MGVGGRAVGWRGWREQSEMPGGLPQVDRLPRGGRPPRGGGLGMVCRSGGGPGSDRGWPGALQVGDWELTARRPADHPAPGPRWARAALRLSRAESSRPPVVRLCPARPGWPAARGSAPSGQRPGRGPVLLNKAGSRKLEWPLKREIGRERPASRELYYSLSGASGACLVSGHLHDPDLDGAPSGQCLARVRAAGPEGARGVVSWMQAELGGSGTSGPRLVPRGHGRRQGAGCRKAAALSPGTVSTPTARPRGGGQGQGLGHPGDP